MTTVLNMQWQFRFGLNHENIVKDSQGILKMKTYLNRYDRKENHFSSHVEDWKRSWTNNTSIAFNVWWTKFDENVKDEIKQAYISKCHFNLENKVILLIVTDGEKWHHVDVKYLFYYEELLQEMVIIILLTVFIHFRIAWKCV